MPRIIKNTLLKYIPYEIATEKTVNSKRITPILKTFSNGNLIVYLCEREIRIKDNFALQFAISKSQKLNLQLKIIHPKTIYHTNFKQSFLNEQIINTQKAFLNNNLDFEIYKNTDILNYLIKLKTHTLIIDFNPILNRKWLKKANFNIFEIDSHNIVPARFISDKQEYNASTFRNKIYKKIPEFLTEFKNLTNQKTESEVLLETFIKEKLPYYAEFKNNPIKNVTSNLSKYLNLGFISSQRVAIEILKSKVDDINKEAFLEELIIRKELADNFCLYSKNFNNFNSIPQWAKNSLNEHKQDLRNYFYSIKDFEIAKTHDELWNATQHQLIKEGIIHGYLRMYWAKKILEWSITPEIALKTTIYLNDKYALDAPSCNGYTGILWAISGLHDRAFQNFPITGKIRRMVYNSIKKKFEIEKYIKKYNK